MENNRKHRLDDRLDRSAKFRRKNASQLEQIHNSSTRDATEKDTKSTQDIQLFSNIKRARIIPRLKNLVHDLDDILNDDTKDILLELISKKALAQCLDLRDSLKESQEKLEAKNIQHQPESNPSQLEPSRLPMVVSPLSLSPWKSSSIPTNYPPLPQILDPTLETATFIHCSASAGHKGALNYEQLELIGDAYMELIATLLISQTFPYLTPGKQSQIREMLVKNITLANYSLQYKFDKRLKMDGALLQSTSLTKVKVLGDVFEAYVAAVILSDPVNGIEKASLWLKNLWGMTISATILEEEKSDRNTPIHLWQLQGNLTPEKVAEKFNNRPIQLNAKEQLQKLIGGKHAKLSYKEDAPQFKDPSTKLAVFSIGVYLDGWGEKNKLLGSGKANGKKEAGLKAAAAALKNEHLIKNYADQKIALRELETKNE